MGQEIVYCFKCATRLLGSDFEHGRAIRAGNRAACKDCATDLLNSLPKEERPDPTPPKTARFSSSTKLKSAPSPSSSSRMPLAKPHPRPPRPKTGLYCILGALGLAAAG